MAFQPNDPRYNRPSSIEVSFQPSRIRAALSRLLPVLRRVSSSFSRCRVLLTSPTINTPAIACVDPAESSFHACVAASPFFYVSPALYGLIGTIDERGFSGRTFQPGDEV